MSQQITCRRIIRLHRRYWIFFAWLIFSANAIPSQADIYQWRYVNGDPNQGKEQSTTPCPGGAGVSPEPNADIHGRDLTQAYLIGANLQNAYAYCTNLTNADLTAAEVMDVDFGHATLTNATLKGTNLAGADFFYATITGANLTGATVTDANFAHTDLTDTQLYSTASYAEYDLHGIDLGGAFSAHKDLSGWNLAGQNMTGAGLAVATLTNADFSGSNLTRAGFVKSNLTGADFTGARVAEANFDSSNLAADQLYSTASYAIHDLHGIRLPGCTLTGWNLTGQNLVGASFGSCVLSGVNFSDTNLTGSRFFNSPLTGCNLTGATVSMVDFGRTGLTSDQLYSTASYAVKDLHGINFNPYNPALSVNLQGWNLAGQNLTNASLGSCDLTQVNLSNANLTNAYFGSANLSETNVTNAIVIGAGFYNTNLTNNQLYSTASYKAGDLHEIRLGEVSLYGWDFAGQNLTGADFYGATLTSASFANAAVAEASFQGTNLTASQLYSTTSYQKKDLHGIGLSGVNLYGWNLGNQNLTGARLGSSTLAYANLAGATIVKASFLGSNLTATQLYTTASYVARDLHGIVFGADATGAGFDLRGWNFCGQNLMGAEFYVELMGFAQLDGADFSGADLRGAYGASVESATIHNTILDDGTIHGLSLASGECLVVRNYDTTILIPPGYGEYSSIPIMIQDHVILDPTASLQFVFDGKPWVSTISFDSDISSIFIDGELNLTLAPNVLPSDLVGETYQLFDWTGVSCLGEFDIVGDPRWDTSRLYSSGEITFVPEPNVFLLVGVGMMCLLISIWLRQKRVSRSANV